jgi:EAL domain-containing protein (putative c-di-GMP-specific phosphodiesterase class I)/FixJ family two-component response regulator
MHTGTLSFLVLEHDGPERQLTVQMLRGLGASVVYEAEDGHAALERLEDPDTRVDIIISDVDMPSMDGMELMRHMGSGQCVTSFIVASAIDRGLLASVEAMAAAYGVNFLGVIEKPVTIRKLEGLIELHGPAQTLAIPPLTTAMSFTVEQVLEGLERDEFEAIFQPQVDLATARVAGVEALARWIHPEHGMITPSAFIRRLEQSSNIDILTRCILKRSARFRRELDGIGADCPVAVNISLTSLNDVAVADQITRIVRDESVSPRDMVLELTERTPTTDVGRLLENLTRLRMNGFELSIDDFGTGYSSLEQLARIPLTEIKIDQSFVTHAGEKDAAKVILESSLDLAHKLKLRAVAEGVESQANWDLLAELGCEFAQGYFIAKPMGASACLEWIRERL